MKKLLVYLLPFFVFQSCRSQKIDSLPVKTDNNSLLWEITGKGIRKPSYLFGTFHLMCKEDIRFSENLKKAIAASEEMYLEMDMDDPANTIGALFFMNMKDGKTLRDLYTPEEYKRLDQYFTDTLGMGLMMFQRMKPNFLEAMLYPSLMPCKRMSGVEEELMSIAKKEKKEIRGFETIAFQASVFDSIPYEEQAKGLLRTIDSLETYRIYFDQMLREYKTQQLAKIEATIAMDPTFAESREVMLDKRNRNWVEQLKDILSKKNIFMGVGAGHLVGKEGVIELLRKEGYTVRPIVNE